MNERLIDGIWWAESSDVGIVRRRGASGRRGLATFMAGTPLLLEELRPDKREFGKRPQGGGPLEPGGEHLAFRRRFVGG